MKNIKEISVDLYYIPAGITVFIVGLITIIYLLLKHGLIGILDTSSEEFWEGLFKYVDPYMEYYNLAIWLIIIYNMLF